MLEEMPPLEVAYTNGETDPAEGEEKKADKQKETDQIDELTDDLELLALDLVGIYQ
jgi:hypothetical protein